MAPFALEATFPKVEAVVDFPKKAPKSEVPIEIIASVVVALAWSCSFSNLSKSLFNLSSIESFVFENFSCKLSTCSSIFSFNLSWILILKSVRLSFCFEMIFKSSFLYKDSLFVL